MRRLTLVGLIVLLGLAGCATIPPAAPPTDKDVERYYGVMLDKTWIGTGLSGVMDRPTVSAAAPAPLSDWSQLLYVCMDAKGFQLLDFGGNPVSGYTLGGTVALDPPKTASDSQLAFYMCLAANPPSEIQDGHFLSLAQLNYVYDYYMTWVVPCLAHNGWALRNAPSRDEFIELEGAWSPYESIIVRDVGDFQTSEGLCGPSRPSLG